MSSQVKVMLSNRHVHLSTEALNALFGEGAELTLQAQMGREFAANETVTLVGPAGEYVLEEDVIVARRHVHMNLATAAELGVVHDQIVSLKCDGDRPLIFGDVRVVASDRCREFVVHLDSEEGNAAGLKSNDMVTVVV